MSVARVGVRRVDGHVAYSGSRAVAWYRLTPQRWNWRSAADREQMIIHTAQRLAQLTGRRLTLRVTNRPSSAADWGRRVRAATPIPLQGWDAHVDGCVDRLAGLDLTEKEVYLGIEIERPPARWLGLLGRSLERSQTAVEIAEIDRIVAGPGLEATKATGDEIQWLLHRSVLLGCPAPDIFDLGDLDELVDKATWTVEPYGRTVKVVADMAGGHLTRHVAIMTVGRITGDLSPADPWLARTDALGFPVEWAATLDVLPARQVAKAAQSALQRIRSQLEHYQEHNMDPPFSLEATRQRALEVNDELERGFEDLSTRVDSWWRCAVSGATEEETLARAARIADLFAPAIKIVRPAGAYRLGREFIPNEPLSNNAYRRRLPVVTAAAAQPAVTAQVGHRSGLYLGSTCGAGGKHAVFFDTHRSMEQRERSGVAVLAGEPGAGKSSLLGNIVYQSTLQGTRWTVLDPSGPLARLCDLPELAGRARHVDLLQARPGVLNPYRVIGDPVRSHFSTGAEYEHARSMAAAQRRQLCADVLAAFLPSQLADQPETLIALRTAVRDVPAGRGSSPRMVIDALRHIRPGEAPDTGRHGRTVAEFLLDVAQLPAAQLVFPTGDVNVDYEGADDVPLTVITMRGLALPRQDSDRRDWSTEEAMSLPLLQLASWMVQQSMYAGERHIRRGLAFDEAWALSRVSSGRLLVNTAARDSRKHNTRVLLSSQNVGDITLAGISNLVAEAFVGRTEDPDAQVDALRILRVPVGVGYEAALASLSPHSRGASGRSGAREFVFADGEGGVERISIDLSGLPVHVRQALDTTANPLQVTI